MARNWIRACSLIVSGAKSQKDLAALRVVFSIEQWHLQAPNMARFRVYNCSPSTVSAFQAKEFTDVTFSAGYQDNIGVVFAGQIVQTIAGHETAVDSYVDIFAADGATGYISARVTKTLAAGYTPQDKLQVALDAMKPFGITLGLNTLDLSQPKYPRGLPMVGMARDVIRQVALSAGGLWSIQQGQVKLTSKTLDAPGSAITLSASTGLIGWPKQTQDGIYTTSLLNASLQPLMKIKLDPSQIIAAERDNNPFSGSAPITNQFLDQQALGAGTYTIFHMNRRGDTRGPDWYDECLSIGVGGLLGNDALSRGYSDSAKALGIDLGYS